MKSIYLIFISIFFLTACSSQAPLADTDPVTGLPTVSRSWERALTSDAPINTNIAHQQLDQQSPTHIQEELRVFLSSLEGMTSWATKISVPGARAVFTPDTTAATAAADERVHLHPSTDGSLHIALPDQTRTQYITSLWRGEAHPRNPTTAMLYGPRDARELEIIKQIIMAVYETHSLE